MSSLTLIKLALKDEVVEKVKFYGVLSGNKERKAPLASTIIAAR